MAKSVYCAVVAAALVAVAPAACSSEGGGEPEEMEAAAFCESETRAEPYSASMTKVGDSGVSVTIADAMPAPPAIFDNQWTLDIADAAGNPIEGATLAVQPFMPDHGHPTNRESVVTEVGGGTYEVDPVNFMMGGYWEVTVDVETADMTDSVIFKFCIPG